jgi:hypothetical protein
MTPRFVRRLVPSLCAVLLTTACAATDKPGSAPPPVDSTDPTPSAAPEAVTEPSPTPVVTVAVPVFVDENGFDDHTVPTIETVPEFFALAESGVNGQSVVKFSIPDLLGDPDGRVHWLDSGFYELHDEWYWYRLLNGQRAPGIDVEPVPGNRFDSIDEIYAWANRLDPAELPLDLRFADSRYTDRPRLFSQNYYDEALNVAERNYLVGSLVHLQSDIDGNQRWLVQLEYTDEPNATDVAAFMQRWRRRFPPRSATRWNGWCAPPVRNAWLSRWPPRPCRTPTGSCGTARSWRPGRSVCTTRASRSAGCCWWKKVARG